MAGHQIFLVDQGSCFHIFLLATVITILNFFFNFFLHFKAFIAEGDIPQEQEVGKGGSSFYFCNQSAKTNH